ncbi:MAG: tRNA (adenosine(37)-N6)-threonylcarbamoyltransferase complex dimerization subunit type 1 TsaB [Candidatus Omnitrophica bacterium]|nr:tRNA (adenosine(37)-N6)-threonylcarbamoyltransferase complex dimerization subunit type 1 TsaB [Candidatus Omnitrophota bacterium]
MKLLSIDTSSKNFSIAISDNEKVLRHRNLELGKQLSSSIIKHIKSLLSAAKLSVKDVDALIVGLGPGSFTSLRVGLATGKALALALKLPVIGISSLDVIAMNVIKEKNICVINDARRDLVYAAFYNVNAEGRLERSGEYLLVDLKSVLSKIKKDFAILGDAVKMIVESERKRLIAMGCKLYDEKYWCPQAKFLPVLAKDKLANKKFDDPIKMVPLYLHAEDCQVSKK